jgi:predicted  nucleic acid-binding Zn-ribbon protein
MPKPKGKAPASFFQATGRVVKLLRPEIEAVRAEVSNINTEIKAINERVKAINEDLDKIAARTAMLKEESGQTGSP